MALFRASVLLRGPPLLERRDGFIVLHRTVVQPELQHVLVGRSDGGTRLDTEYYHDLVAVEVRTDGVQLLLLLKLRDPLLQPVVGPGERGGLAPVTRGAVRAGQLVQPFEERSGVAHVATDGGVRPLSRAIAVEPQMELHET